jgi:hypothetical protein
MSEPTKVPNWIVAMMEFFIELLKTGNPKVDKFIGMMIKCCSLIIILSLLFAYTMMAVDEIVPLLLEPVSHLFSATSNEAGAVLEGLQSSASQVVLPDLPDLPAATK